MTYNEALTYIHSICWKGSRLGLGRTRELLQKLGNPEKQLKFVHIAGTNGKGSCAAMLSSILEAAGYRVGLYISPFINRINELCQPDHIEISSGLALIATVGQGMVRTRGTAAKLFGALYAAGVNVRMIDQGSSELNIIVGVDGEEFEAAVRAIYEAFVGEA